MAHSASEYNSLAAEEKEEAEREHQDRADHHPREALQLLDRRRWPISLSRLLRGTPIRPRRHLLGSAWLRRACVRALSRFTPKLGTRLARFGEQATRRGCCRRRVG